jgi:hypothetical protein
MGTVGESGSRPHENGAQIGICDFGNFHTLVCDQHDILRSGRRP